MRGPGPDGRRLPHRRIRLGRLAVDGLRAGRETEVDLYPQGVERTLTFRPDGGRVRISCVSRTSWVPRPDVEVRAADELMDDCVRLARDFATALAAVAPAVARLPPFDRWTRGGA